MTESQRMPLFDTSIFNGLRVIFNFIVVFGHALTFMPVIHDELPHILLDSMKAGTETVLTFFCVVMGSLLLYAVDIFLFISGFLFAHSFCVKDKNENYTWRHGIQHVKSRFLRLLPIHAVSLAAASVRGGKACTKPSMLWEFFHLLNFNPRFGKDSIFKVSCLFHGWSLSTDFQGHILMVITLILLKSNRRTFQILFLSTIAVVLMRMNFVYQLGRPMVRMTLPDVTLMTLATSKDVLSNVLDVVDLPTGNFSLRGNDVKYHVMMQHDFKLYSSPRLRMAPVFIGFLTWYSVQRQMAIVRWINRNVLLVLLSSIITNFCVLVAALVVADLNGSMVWVAVLFDGMHRFIFTTSFAAFLIAIGHPDNAIKSSIVSTVRILCSTKAVEWISSLSYSIYLMHIYLIGAAARMYPTITPNKLEIWRFFISSIQLYIFSVFLAVPCHYFEKRIHSIVLKRKTINVYNAKQTIKKSE